jgi:hypothetical protein
VYVWLYVPSENYVEEYAKKLLINMVITVAQLPGKQALLFEMSD